MDDPFDKMKTIQKWQSYILQGGYRAGLTIAHGSQVSVQCEGADGPEQMSIYCFISTFLNFENWKFKEIFFNSPFLPM